MTTYLLYDDAMKSPEMRHEIAEPIMDPVVFLEHEGKRIVVGSVLEEPALARREDVVDEFWNSHELGAMELVRDPSVPEHVIGSEIVLRALARAGATTVIVPASFSLLTADYLRARGIDVTADPGAWIARRRRKAPWELEGIERAQRATETAMLIAARMLRDAEPTGDNGHLRFEGEILTAEWIRESMGAALLSQGAESEEIIVHSGDACLSGHAIGTGPILADQSCIIDCFPRDRRTGCYTDMTRTFVPGRPSHELRQLHAHCRAALTIALEALEPGRSDAYRLVGEFFGANGYPTQITHDGREPLTRGFPHALGHGVGLEVHERPQMGMRADEFVEGDVVAVEPGLYFPGVGGVRLEDTVIITDSGYAAFTDPLSYGLTE